MSKKCTVSDKSKFTFMLGVSHLEKGLQIKFEQKVCAMIAKYTHHRVACEMNGEGELVVHELSCDELIWLEGVTCGLAEGWDCEFKHDDFKILVIE